METLAIEIRCATDHAGRKARISEVTVRYTNPGEYGPADDVTLTASSRGEVAAASRSR